MRAGIDKRAMTALAAGHLGTDFANGSLPALLPFFVDRFSLTYTLAATLMLASAASFDGLWCGTGLLHEFSLKLRHLGAQQVEGTLMRHDRVRHLEGSDRHVSTDKRPIWYAAVMVQYFASALAVRQLEGAAMLMLEEEAHARRRGAEILAELAGYGMSADAYHMTAPDPAGRGAVLAMRRALAEARIEPQAVDYVNAHGTGTAQNDPIETRAIKEVFGEHARRLAVSSTKSQTGHCLGAAGAIEILATVLALRHGFLPPTVNLEEPDPECDLDYVPRTARASPLRVAVSNSYGFGGNNTSVVLRAIS